MIFKLVALPLLCSCFGLYDLFFEVPLVGLWSLIVAFPGHTCTTKLEVQSLSQPQNYLKGHYELLVLRLE